MSEVGIQVADGVATVTVDNPPVNAMSAATLRGLHAAARELASGEAARCIVLTGAGSQAFMAGADIAEFEQLRGRNGAMDEHARAARRAFDAWAALPQPVIAAVQASAVGGGLEIALLCDLIVADPAARFGLPEVKLGLIPAGGGTQRLPRRIGPARAKELLLLGTLIDASRALEIGLVDHVSGAGSALARAHELAARIAALPRVAVQAAKRAVEEGGRMDIATALDRERELFHTAFATEDFAEGYRAFLEKRPARFVHR